MKGLRECSLFSLELFSWSYFLGELFHLKPLSHSALLSHLRFLRTLRRKSRAAAHTLGVPLWGPLRISQSYMPGTNHSPDCTSFKKSSQKPFFRADRQFLCVLTYIFWHPDLYHPILCKLAGRAGNKPLTKKAETDSNSPLLRRQRDMICRLGAVRCVVRKLASQSF
jgi:hypothetical protein